MAVWVPRASQWDAVLGSALAVAWSPSLSLFVAGGGVESTTAIATSPNGIDWTARTTPFDHPGGEVRGVAWSGPLGLFVAVGADGPGSTNAIMSSPDGVTWTVRGNPFGGSALGQSVSWDDTAALFVVSSSASTSPTLATSSNGTSWTGRMTPWDGVGLVLAACYATPFGLWVAVGTGGATGETVMTSPDAVTWTERSSQFDGGIGAGVCWSSRLGLLVAVGSDSASTRAIQTSPDATTWTKRASALDTSEAFWVVDTATSLVAVGEPAASGPAIVESIDGITWTADISPFDSGLSTGAFGVAFSPSLSLAVAAGANGGAADSSALATAPFRAATSGIALPDTGGASIAFFSQAFNPNPTWDGPLKDLRSVQIDRGRNYLLSKTQTGTMVLSFYDETGRYDPTNPDSPYFPEIGPMRAVNFALMNPVDQSQNSLFTGFTEIWDFTYPGTPSAVIMEAAVHCVDGFDALNRAEFSPDNTNRTTIPTFVGADAVAGRMLYILSFFSGAPYSGDSFPTDTDALFSGNVDVFDAIYNPQTSLLTGIQDTADAEFPNVSNTFMDKFGNLAFRGRATRFIPENYWNGAGNAPTLAKPISFWNVGDANACAAWPTNPPGSPSDGAMAPFNDLGWDLDQTTLVNACECYPGNIGTQTAAITDQLRTNGLSILKYGPRVLSIPDLYTAGSPAATGNPFLNPPGLTAKQECLLFADYFVQNLATPEPHISTLKFVTVAPGTTRGNAWWNLVCGVEIGDVIVLYTTNPGGGGFSAEQFFVEGIHYDIQIGGPYPQITMTLDVSPRKWFSVFNGFVFYPTNGFMAQDGHATNGSATFVNGGSYTFTPASVGDRLIVMDPTAPAVPGVNPVTYHVAAYVSGSTVTLDATYGGTTSTSCPWEIIRP